MSEGQFADNEAASGPLLRAALDRIPMAGDLMQRSTVRLAGELSNYVCSDSHSLDSTALVYHWERSAVARILYTVEGIVSHLCSVRVRYINMIIKTTIRMTTLDCIPPQIVDFHVDLLGTQLTTLLFIREHSQPGF
jgi:hypothetical protein